MRYLYNQYYKKSKRGFTDQEMQAAVEKIAGKSLDAFFRNHIYGTKPIDYNQHLGYAGLKLVDYNQGRNDPYLGVATSMAGGKLTITSVMRGTAAYEYGLNVNDEILAVNNYRVVDDLNRMIEMKKVGDKVNILISRGGEIQNLEVVLGKNPNGSYRIEKAGTASQQQAAILQNWLKL
jgi:predicted metalloprotease with PDZ domain